VARWPTIQRASAGLSTRGALRLRTSEQGLIYEGPGRIIQVNRWLRHPADSGACCIPAVPIPCARLTFDGTIGWRDAANPQLTDIRTFSGDKIVIIRLTQIGGFYGVYFP